MHKIKRYSLGGVGAVGITFGLGVFMAAMIAVDFKASSKAEVAVFDINPVPENIIICASVQKPEPLKDIETPPPPPNIAVQKAALPSEPIASVLGSIPVFTAPKIDTRILDIAINDRDAQPTVRIEAIMPPRAEKSGHCLVRFNVSPKGAPYDVQTTYCTARVFERPTVRSVQKWKYRPKMLKGRPVAMTGVESRVTYRLTDEQGRLIPE